MARWSTGLSTRRSRIRLRVSVAESATAAASSGAESWPKTIHCGSSCPAATSATWLVLGNHDVDPVNQIRPFKIDRTAVTLYTAGDPPLLLTHVPLLQMPHCAVNVHEHVHDQESPTPNRHVNVSVEQLNYWPARLSEIRRLARRLVERRTVPGHSTRARLNVVERVIP